MLLTLKGLIVRENILNESAKYVTVLTDGRGKLSLLVRGSNKRHGRFFAPTQLFCYSELVVYTNNGKYTLNEASLIDSNFALSNSYDSLTLATYIVNVAEYLIAEEQSDDGMLRLTLNTLWLIAHRKEIDLKLVKGAFELRAAALAGFAPDLVGCAECGKPCPDDGTIFLNVMDGCLLCHDCQSVRNLGTHIENNIAVDESRTAQIILSLPRPVLLAMQYSLWCDPSKLYSFKLSPEFIPQFSSACEIYLENHIEHRFPVLDMM